ncbi:MAG: hypothetical protein ACREFW_06670 [Rhizomicrobium sp.]
MTPGQSGPVYYRARARDMHERAKLAASREMRAVYLELAAYWLQLAERAEKFRKLSAPKSQPATA